MFQLIISKQQYVSDNLYLALLRLLQFKKTLHAYLFNYSNDHEIVKIINDKMYALEFFYNLFVDNLFCDINKISNRNDKIIYSSIHSKVFTNNMFYDMKIDEDAKIALKLLDTLSSETLEIINKYNIFGLGKINKEEEKNNDLTNFLTSNEFHQVYLCRLFFDNFFQLITNLQQQKVNEFNNLMKDYKISINASSNFVFIFLKLINLFISKDNATPDILKRLTIFLLN